MEEKEEEEEEERERKEDERGDLLDTIVNSKPHKCNPLLADLLQTKINKIKIK